MRKRRKGDFQETPDAWTDQVNRIHGTNTPPQGSGRYASANRAKNKARKKKKKVPVIVPTQPTKKGPGKQTGPIEGRGLKR